MKIGLLDSRVVSGKQVSVRLPIVDAAGARKVLDESSSKSNELLKNLATYELHFN